MARQSGQRLAEERKQRGLTQAQLTETTDATPGDDAKSGPVGGVNACPREVEDVLVTHPAVEDVAVFGLPDPEFGENVKAVVQPATGCHAGEQLAQQLIAFTRERLAHLTCPRSVELLDRLPRKPAGKLQLEPLRAGYCPATTL